MRASRSRGKPPRAPPDSRSVPSKDSAPDFAGDIGHQLEFRPLLILGQHVALHRRRKSALRTDGQLLQRKLLSSFVDAPEKIVFLLQLRPFRAHEPKHHGLSLRHQAQWLEIARSLIVIFQKESVDRKLITGITVFDVYEGQGIAPGKKSIAIAVTLQPRGRTMTDAEIDALAAKIVAEVGKRTGGVLRG